MQSITGLGLSRHLEKLRGFWAVAKTRSFHRASSEVAISQPALSRSIQALEKALGHQLFFRSRQGVALTVHGQIVFDFCDRLFAEIAHAEKKLELPSDLGAGIIDIGTFESLTIYLWPRFLKQFAKSHSGLQVRLSSGNEGEHRRRLLAGALQMVVEAEPIQNEALKSLVLYQDSFRLYAIAGMGKAWIASAPLIYVPHAVDREGRSIRDHLLQGGIRAERLVFALDTFSSALEFARNGLGVAVLPTRLLEGSGQHEKLQPVRMGERLAESFGRHRICATFLESDRSDPRIKAVLSELKLSAALRPGLRQ